MAERDHQPVLWAEGVTGDWDAEVKPYTAADGNARTVQPGQAAPIRDGLKIQFGRVQGTIKA